ncbi:hypothetical protein B0O80DRAFT_436887 [Mortierella sp. GBAus27b]|nr:hypothetical protein B0O80DRAFT_436887 [Mortierella sp. GBAus27b]
MRFFSLFASFFCSSSTSHTLFSLPSSIPPLDQPLLTSAPSSVLHSLIKHQSSPVAPGPPHFTDHSRPPHSTSRVRQAFFLVLTHRTVASTTTKGSSDLPKHLGHFSRLCAFPFTSPLLQTASLHSFCNTPVVRYPLLRCRTVALFIIGRARNITIRSYNGLQL